MSILSEHEARRAALATAIAGFIAAVEAQPDARFLHERDGRTPRDIVAHLIGWNHGAVATRAAIARGELPDCLVEPGPDFGNTNARAMATYPSREKAILLAQLLGSAAAWDAMLRDLPAAEWDGTNGGAVGGRGRSRTARWSTRPTEDHAHHRKEISQWSA